MGRDIKVNVGGVRVNGMWRPWCFIQKEIGKEKELEREEDEENFC